MTNLILVGSGGLARELCAWLPRSNLASVPVLGVVNDTGIAPDRKDWSIPFLGTVEDYHFKHDDVFICAFGQPESKFQTVQFLQARKARFATVIHETSVIGQRVQIGGGSIICPNVVLTADVHIGRHVLINVMSSVGHDATIGDYSTLSGHCDVTGNVFVGEGVFLGTHACVAPQRLIGDWARVGAGSVVIRDVPRQSAVFGNPAQVIRRKNASKTSPIWESTAPKQ